MLYTVIAYRWGWLNNHQYQVAATADALRANELALEECEDRGGKYGVAVYEWVDEGNCRLSEYHGSSYGEELPFHNERLAMFSSVGHDAHRAATEGTHWAVGPDSTLTSVPAEVPAWLIDSVRRHEVQSRLMSALAADAKLRHATQAGPLRDEDTARMLRDVEQAVDQLLARANRPVS